MSKVLSANAAKERKAFIVGLLSLSGIGAKTVFKILNICRKKQLAEVEFWANRYHIWQEMLLKEKTIESIKNFKKEHHLLDNLSKIENSGIQVLTFEEAAYPKLLTQIEDLPPALFVKSRIQITSQAWQHLFNRTLSVVGTRRMSAYGRLVINHLIPDLILAKQVIVSGFMYGVDLFAAQTALNHRGQTVAVLGYGLNCCFPASQRKIMQQFFEQGAIFLSEFIPEAPARAANFVTRNRIVAALSKATLIIEAASRSGSHITASYAADYGRLVLAVPGPITNPFSEGTKILINQGAILVNNAMDVLREISTDYHWQNQAASTSLKNQNGDNQAQQILLENLGLYPDLSLETLQQNTQLAPDQLNQLLFELELQGKIIKKWGKYCLVS